jgi:hypothetical protein
VKPLLVLLPFHKGKNLAQRHRWLVEPFEVLHRCHSKDIKIVKPVRQPTGSQHCGL